MLKLLECKGYKPNTMQTKLAGMKIWNNFTNQHFRKKKKRPATQYLSCVVFPLPLSLAHSAGPSTPNHATVSVGDDSVSDMHLLM